MTFLVYARYAQHDAEIMVTATSEEEALALGKAAICAAHGFDPRWTHAFV